MTSSPEGTERSFSLVHQVVPASAGEGPHPGLILLHGLGDSEQGLLMLAPQLDPRFVVLSARAPLRHRWGGYAWYDIEQHGPGLGSESIEHALDRLDRFLDEALEAYPIDRGQLYVGGFSMGAAMAGALSLLHPGRIAGAIMVSGYLPPDVGGRYARAGGAQGLPVFQATGMHDPLVRLEYARLTRDALIAAGVDLTYREYAVAHAVSLEELQDIRVWLEGRLRSRGEGAG